MNSLIELAERCAAASADAKEQRSLLREAFEAIHGPKPERVHEGSAEMTAYLHKFNPFYSLITHYGFLDAAMTLVPEGWRAGFEENASCDEPGKSYAWVWPFESSYDPDWMLGQEGQQGNPDAEKGYAATPALALCAASLRARASLNRGDQ